VTRILVFIPRKELDPERYDRVLSQAFPDHSIEVVESLPACAAAIPEAEVLVLHGGIVDDATIQRAGKLRWMHNLITGMDWISRLPSLGADVMLTRSRIHGPQMSEMAIMHMIALSRGLPGFLTNQRNHVWQRWSGQLMDRRTVGILGIGAIAETLAPKLRALGMTVIGISGASREVDGIDRFVDRDRLAEIAPELDYLVVIVPLSESTRGIVDAGVFKAMKPSAYLVNIARGGVVDEAAMIEALKAGEIAGAGLDVFSVEPLPDDSPLWDMENVIITPHVGGWSRSYAEAAVAVTENNLRCYLEGRFDDMDGRVR